MILFCNQLNPTTGLFLSSNNCSRSFIIFISKIFMTCNLSLSVDVNSSFTLKFQPLSIPWFSSTTVAFLCSYIDLSSPSKIYELRIFWNSLLLVLYFLRNLSYLYYLKQVYYNSFNKSPDYNFSKSLKWRFNKESS